LPEVVEAERVAIWNLDHLLRRWLDRATGREHTLMDFGSGPGGVGMWETRSVFHISMPLLLWQDCLRCGGL